MDKNKFNSAMVLLVPQVVKLICENYSIDEICAANKFYNSAVYECLEDEQTKLWHLSANALFDMFDREQQNGTLTFPEGV